ncbi:YnfA family protein [Planomicrobium sp. Y74]|uniref:YnfA family protein n=1 Tax=Planomicrobium sp. Y74 TaxID=2478977 RepID=UPI000EF47D09|nr:YnfA family protein [Planomicrobium sp. Y74]RLQ84927.1 YnfA family protein [Planomicrobium sp. Y74]
MIYPILLVIITGIAEFGGDYLIWLWLREGTPLYLGIFGGIELALYGMIATFHSFSSFGRIYAAYGGVFIILSVLWGWGIDKKTPDLYGWVGASICLAEVSAMLWETWG